MHMGRLRACGYGLECWYCLQNNEQTSFHWTYLADGPGGPGAHCIEVADEAEEGEAENDADEEDGTRMRGGGMRMRMGRSASRSCLRRIPHPRRLPTTPSARAPRRRIAPHVHPLPPHPRGTPRRPRRHRTARGSPAGQRAATAQVRGRGGGGVPLPLLAHALGPLPPLTLPQQYGHRHAHTPCASARACAEPN